MFCYFGKAVLDVFFCWGGRPPGHPQRSIVANLDPKTSPKWCPKWSLGDEGRPFSVQSQRKGGGLRPPPFVVSFALALNTGHVLLLRRKTCALLLLLHGGPKLGWGNCEHNAYKNNRYLAGPKTRPQVGAANMAQMRRPGCTIRKKLVITARRQQQRESDSRMNNN